MAIPKAQEIQLEILGVQNSERWAVVAAGSQCTMDNCGETTRFFGGREQV